MRQGWTVPPIWKGERCFIIAGGQTAREVVNGFINETDRPRLPDYVMAVKDAAFLQPFAQCMFYADKRFHKFRPEVWQVYKGPMRVKRSVDENAPQGVLQVRRARADSRGINGLSLDPALLGGHDSGGSALNLAFHFGAKEIVLIGFDLMGHHWNPDHPLPRAKMRAHLKHRASIDAMAAPLRSAGVKVLNASRLSTLREYRYVPLRHII